MIRWCVQMAVLAALIAVFALQVPRSALFFRPVKSVPVVAHAAFVTLDDAAYLRLMRQVRTAEWSGIARNWPEGSMSLGAGPVALEDELPPPPGLDLPASFMGARVPAPHMLAPPAPSLQPQSLSSPQLPPLQDGGISAREPEKGADPLLDIDSFESLKER